MTTSLHNFFLLACCWLLVPFSGLSAQGLTSLSAELEVLTGADQPEVYLPMLDGQRVALVVNQTSVVHAPSGELVPLLDTLLSCRVDVRCLMSPEHGYSGKAGAGEAVGDGRTSGASSLQIHSLYGKTKKPQAEWLRDVDVVVFDLQDVGTRFYTYLSTLYYVLQACGEQQKQVVVLDRPNPNDTIDGPMRDASHASFVGIVPIPLLHGCTLGELAQMMVGQRWTSAPAPSLNVVLCRGWRHGMAYSLPIAPSPNLPNDQAIALYPSLCLFEGTSVSVGRGTAFPFQAYGHPGLKGSFTFTPQASASNKQPLQLGKVCRGRDLREVESRGGLSLGYVADALRELGAACVTSPKFFDLLAGTEALRKQLLEGLSEADIRQSWQAGLQEYRSMRQKYVLYDE